MPKRTPLSIALLALVGLTAARASAEVVWSGDLSTGDFSQWTKSEQVSEDRLQVVNDGASGEVALKATVHQGDDPINASGNRAELVYVGDPATEEERYYAWSTLWPEDYASAPNWQLFTQWHHDGTNGSPPAEFFVNGEDVILRINGVDMWRTPLERGRWHDFVFHVKWSADEREGFVELIYDGKPALKRTPIATLYPGQGVYLKQGLYRDEDISQPQTILHRGMTIATSMGDIRGHNGRGRGQQDDEYGPSALSEDGKTMTFPNGETMDVQAAGCASAGPTTLLPVFGAAFAVMLVMRRRRREARVTVRARD